MSHLTQGTTADGEISVATGSVVMAELRGHSRPEFLNRVNDIVLFRPLGLEEIKQIVDLSTGELWDRLHPWEIEVEIADPAR